MRYTLAVVALLGLAGLGLNRAQAQYYCDPRPMPNPATKHCPIYVYPNGYWAPCGYGIYGPTDRPGQPVNGLGVPPYCPCLQRDACPAWHRYIRSPRDFWMLEY
jgi:hypothetical protein